MLKLRKTAKNIPKETFDRTYILPADSIEALSSSTGRSGTRISMPAWYYKTTVADIVFTKDSFDFGVRTLSRVPEVSRVDV